MKYLIDAQLPKHLKAYFNFHNFEAIHLLDIDSSGKLSDKSLIDYALLQNLIIVSKDTDFLDSHILIKKPEKLLLISTGNISNPRLINIFQNHIKDIDMQFQKTNLIEITASNILYH